MHNVEAKINGQWVQLTKTVNNNHAYYNNAGAYSFPMEVRVTPVCGASVNTPPLLPAACCLHLNCLGLV